MPLTINDLIKAGLHFGHAAASWNPKMKPYLLGIRKKVHIFDLRHTVKSLVAATQLVRRYSAEGKKIIFVGTKLQAQALIKEVAQATGNYYVNERWLGGMLTNHDIVMKRLRRLDELEKIDSDEAAAAQYSKKVLAGFRREMKKLRRDLDGVRGMESLADLMVVIDPRLDYIAVSEANISGIPVIALTDSNSDPDRINLVIPGNDDAVRSIRFVLYALRDAILEGRQASEQNEEEKSGDHVSALPVGVIGRGAAAQNQVKTVQAEA